MKNKNMKKNNLLRNQEGFTLIEIIAVLIILGILAAVAIPRYMNLQEDARLKAAQGAIAEIKAQASTQYAKQMLVNNGVAPTAAQVNGNLNTNLGTDYTVATNASSGTGITITVSAVQGVAVNNATGTWTMP